MTRCDIRVTFAGNDILWSKVLLNFVCLVYNAVQFNPQVISFSTMYNSPYKISTKKYFFCFFLKKYQKLAKFSFPLRTKVPMLSTVFFPSKSCL